MTAFWYINNVLLLILILLLIYKNGPNSLICIVIPKRSAIVIPRNESDEESCFKDFPLPLEVTV